VGGNIKTKLNDVQERLITIKCGKIKINIVRSIRIKQSRSLIRWMCQGSLCRSSSDNFK
jgi:hypothetical protein